MDTLGACRILSPLSQSVSMVTPVPCRYSVSSRRSGLVPSLTISDSQTSDSGFYHCRVEVPGPFNDQVFTIYLIIIRRRTFSQLLLTRPLRCSTDVSDVLQLARWSPTSLRPRTWTRCLRPQVSGGPMGLTSPLTRGGRSYERLTCSAGYSTVDVTAHTGSDVTAGDTALPRVALVQVPNPTTCVHLWLP